MEGRGALDRVICVLTAGLAFVVLAAKAWLLPFPVSTALEFVRWALRLAIVASADLVFVGGLALSCFLVARVAATAPFARSRHWRSAGRWLLVAVFQGAALYAVAAVPMFRLTMAPLTIELLSFAGGPSLMASSLAGFATPWTVAALVAAPVLLGFLAMLAARRAPLVAVALAQPTRMAGLAAAGLGLALYGWVCHAYIERNWTDPNRWERRIAASPHTVFLASCLDELTKRDRLTLSFDPVDVDMSDFEPPARAAHDDESDHAVVRVAAHLPLAERPQHKSPQNLIVIVLESVGAEYLGLYGAPYDNTPRLAELLARGGTAFENFYAHAASSPKALVALSASVVPRVDWKLITRDSPQFDVPLLPQVLAERGYRTCYLHSGYWSWKRRDEFLRTRGVETLLDAENLDAKQVFSWGISDDDLFDAALEWIDADRSRPFQLLLWTIETHHPYIAGEQPRDFGVEDEELNRYLNAIRQSDRRIGDFVDELARRGLADATLVAVTGDHGEVFGEHGQRVHSFGVYEENVRVPFILLHPSLAGGPASRGEICQQVDLSATLLGRLGIERPDGWQGRDLLDEGAAARAYFFSTGNEVLLGLREGRFKYIYHVALGHEELYDLVDDPREVVNIAEREPERCASYRRRVGGLVRAQREFLAAHGSP